MPSPPSAPSAPTLSVPSSPVPSPPSAPRAPTPQRSSAAQGPAPAFFLSSLSSSALPLLCACSPPRIVRTGRDAGHSCALSSVCKSHGTRATCRNYFSPSFGRARHLWAGCTRPRRLCGRDPSPRSLVGRPPCPLPCWPWAQPSSSPGEPRRPGRRLERPRFASPRIEWDGSVARSAPSWLVTTSA